MNEPLGPVQMLGTLLELQRRQADAAESMATATRSMASDMRALVSRDLRVALVYPWPNDRTIVRAVLVSSHEEERRLSEALTRFDDNAGHTTLEAWLTEQGFRPLPIINLSLGRGSGRSRP